MPAAETGVNLFDLKDRTIVVTGGLGQLGRQFTRALLNAGARVAVLDVAPAGEDFEETGRCMYLTADVTDRASLQRAEAEIDARWGPVFGLINNAALDSPPGAPADTNGPFEDMPIETFDRIIDVNVRGVFLCCQVFGKSMAREERGSIVNVASIYGMVAPDQTLYQYRRDRGEIFFKPAPYSVSKSALYNLTRYLAVYWGDRQVRVNTVSFAGVFRDQDPEFLRGYEAKVPLGRMAREDDYNGAIVFLMSDASVYMTGSNMVIDGGFTSL